MRLRTKKAKAPVKQRKLSEVLRTITQKKRLKLFLSLLVLLFIVIYFVTGSRGTYKLITFYSQKSKLENEIQQLETEKNELEEFKSKLENDPEAIEQVAREKYKMKKKGERVYQIVEK